MPQLSELPRLITDPTRGEYYKNHYDIDGVKPPTVSVSDGRTQLDFWIKGDPVTHVVATLQADGRVTVEF